MTLDGKRTVDRQAEPVLGAARLGLAAHLEQGRLQFGDALAGVGRGGNQRSGLQEGAVDQVADLQLDHLAGGLVHQVALGQGDHSVLESQQLQDFQVLARLRHDRVVGRDHQHGQVDTGGPGQHVLDKTLVAGNIDNAQPEGGQLQVSEANVNGDAAGFFFGQAVAVNAGQGLDQRGLAVVDVPGGAQDQVGHHCRTPSPKEE